MTNLFSAIVYVLVILPISIMPFYVIYILSDIAFFLVYRIIGYRKQVVRLNLRNSFPQKKHAELVQTERMFYKQFCDNILESLKGLTMSKQQVNKRMQCLNPKLLDKFYNQGKSVIITTGHYYSWELWFLAIDMPVKHKIVLIYKQLSNAYFEKKLKKIRESFGVLPVEFHDIKPFFETKEDGTFGYIFGSDQAPHNANKAYWVNFLNQETPVAFGAEKFAIELDIPVVFCRINPIKGKRGFYEFEYVEIETDPQNCEQGSITKGFTLELENTIKNDPVGWLWTHKRWKRKKPDNMPVHSLL